MTLKKTMRPGTMTTISKKKILRLFHCHLCLKSSKVTQGAMKITKKAMKMDGIVIAV